MRLRRRPPGWRAWRSATCCAARAGQARSWRPCHWDAPPAAHSEQCWAGGDRVMACGLDIRIVRWWDPSPVFGPLSRARLDHGYGVLARLCAAAEQAPGLAGQDGPAQLAACCAGGDLAGAVEAAEH